MDKDLKLYPFGYVFSDVKLQNTPNYYLEKKINNYYYYYDKSTQHHLSIKNNDFLLLHGDYIHIGIYNDIATEDLAETLLDLYIYDYDEYLNTLDFIAGRFTIIIKYKDNIYLFPDATNGRSNYFTKDRIMASSHAKLIADILEYEDIKHNEHITEKILISTPFSNIKSAIPNHFIELKSNKIQRFFPRRNNQYVQMDEEKRFKLVERFWKKQIDHYFKYPNHIIFSITGGLDSRFALSLSKKYIKDFSFFTYALRDKIDNSNPTSKMLSKDYGVVKQLLNDLPLKHKFFFFHDNPVELTDNQEYIMQKNTISKHNPHLVKYVYNAFGENLLHLRGNLLEIGQAYLHRNNKVENSPDSAKNAFIKIHKSEVKDVELLENMYDNFSENLNYFSNTFDYHLVDLVYWELRMGRWICEVSNNHDTIFRTINPFNHRALICISLSFPYEERRNGYMFKEIINRNFPLLNFYGINNLKNLYEQSKTITPEVANKKEHETIASNKKYFTEFIINDEKNNISMKTKEHNEIYLPKFLNKKGEYAEVIIPFERENGLAYISLQNRYSSRDYKKFIYYEIYKNDDLLLREDISNWQLPNHLSIPGLIKGDNIKIRLYINKTLGNQENWEAHSSLRILEFHQISSKMSDKHKINYSSPYSIV